MFAVFLFPGGNADSYAVPMRETTCSDNPSGNSCDRNVSGGHKKIAVRRLSLARRPADATTLFQAVPVTGSSSNSS